MKSLRESIEENYEPVEVPCSNRRGFRIRYEYIGPWYQGGEDAVRRKREKRTIGNACAVSLMLFLAGSTRNLALNYDRYVEFFGMLSAAVLLFEVIGTVQFCTAKEKVTDMNYSDINAKLRLAPTVHALLLLCTAAACMAAMAGNGVTVSGLGVTMCYLGAAAASFMIYIRYSRLTLSSLSGKMQTNMVR